MSTEHIPVLLQEVIEGLSIHAGDTVVDATVGGGGYTKALCDVVGSKGKVIGFDVEQQALDRAKIHVSACPCEHTFVQTNFRDVDTTLENLGITEIDAIVFDLGISSFHLESSGRGFTFLSDEPLSMTLTDTVSDDQTTAQDVVNGWAEESIADVLYGYGEERYARRIAKAIVEVRQQKPIETTQQLVQVIESAVPASYRRGKIHPATRTFQALRIAVNDELGSLTEALPKAYSLLRKGGRMAVVSFHSLEDRLVKQFFKHCSAVGATAITKKPIIPTETEKKHNPRSRSAKLRILQK